MYKKRPTIKEIFTSAIQNHKKKNFKISENLYNEILNIDPNHVLAHNNLGLVFAQSGELQKAISYYEKALVLDPNKEIFNSNYGELLLSLNQHKKGLEYIKKGAGCINFTQDSFEII